MGQNTRLHQITGSLMNLGMIACKRPCLSRMCCQLGVQMGTPRAGHAWPAVAHRWQQHRRPDLGLQSQSQD